MRRVYPLLVASLFWLAMTGVVQAKEAGFCVTTKDAMLAIRNAGETIVFRGISKIGHLVTIYLSKKTQTFTALVHYKDGRSCFVDFGTEGQITPIEGNPI
jgi:hypothetical protein